MALVAQRLPATIASVGGHDVLRALPRVGRRTVGPFCFLDHFGPHTVAGEGVAPHPHLGLATVTYLFEGATLHRDSLGTQQLITPGAVNFMFAGRGIVHSERPPSPAAQVSHGLQLWVAVPSALEEAAPWFQHAGAAELPAIEDGARARVLLGDWSGLRSPVRATSPMSAVVAELEPGASLELATQFPERAVYVVEGVVTLDGQSAERGELLALEAGVEGCVSAVTPAKVLVLAGEPLDGPRFMSWNFVSSRKERLLEARDAWIARRFPLIPGDADERIPFPGEGG